MPGKCEVCEAEAVLQGLRISRLTLSVCRRCAHTPFMTQWREERALP